MRQSIHEKAMTKDNIPINRKCKDCGQIVSEPNCRLHLERRHHLKFDMSDIQFKIILHKFFFTVYSERRTDSSLYKPEYERSYFRTNPSFIRWLEEHPKIYYTAFETNRRRH